MERLGKLQKPVKLASLWTEIQTQHLLNMNRSANHYTARNRMLSGSFIFQLHCLVMKIKMEVTVIIQGVAIKFPQPSYCLISVYLQLT